MTPSPFVLGRKSYALKYLFAFLALIFIVLTISYRKGALPPNKESQPGADFIHLTAPPKEVANLLRQWCYDCHSTQTKYPSMAHFYPYNRPYVVSVNLGREKLNFSNWASYSSEMQKVLLLIAVEQMENGDMPLLGIFPQGDDTLSQNSKHLLIQWMAQEAEAGM